MKFKYLILLFSFSIIFFTEFVQAAPVQVTVAPYVGDLINTVPVQRGTGTTTGQNVFFGLFVQGIQEKTWQSNIFMYGGNNINHSVIGGFNWVFDYDLPSDFIVGGGVAYTYIHTSLTTPAGPRMTLNIDNTPNIWDPYLRVGRYFRLHPSENFSISLLPWVGYLYENININAQLNSTPPVPAMDYNDTFDDNYHFAYLGLNTSLNYKKWLNFSLKYAGRYRLNKIIKHTVFSYKNLTYLNDFTAEIEISFTKNWALTYRGKIIESLYDFDVYHLFGVAYTTKLG